VALRRTGTVTGWLPVIIKKAKRDIGGERRSMSRTSAPRIAGAACPGIAASGAGGPALLISKTGAGDAVPAFTDL
jgi:hypothetical protein